MWPQGHSGRCRTWPKGRRYIQRRCRKVKEEVWNMPQGQRCIQGGVEHATRSKVHSGRC